MKIAVTGATGFIGRNLITKLSETSNDITALCHRSDGLPEWNENIRIVRGSVEESASLDELIEGADIVCHLVGIIAETREKTFNRTVAEATVRLVESARRQGVKRIVYISALGTSRDSVSHYHKTKYLAEEAIRGSGIDYVILRPSVVVGKGDGFTTLLTKMIKLAPMTPIIGSGKFRLQPVYIDDLTDSMILALSSENVVNQIINIAGPDELEYVEIIASIKKRLGKKRMNIYLPISVMRLVAGMLELVLKPAPITRDQLLMMETGNTGDISAMRKLIGRNPISFPESLSKIYNNAKLC